eukprot:PITA_02041
MPWDGDKQIGIKTCTGALAADRAKYIREEEEAQYKSKKSKGFFDPSSISHSQRTSPASSQGNGYEGTGSPGLRRRTISDFLDEGCRNDVDSNVYRFLYACGIPFNFLRSRYWHKMVSAINDAPKGYKSRGYEKAITVGLDHEKAKISHSLNRMTSSWTDHGVSIVSNGWTNVKGKPLISVLAVSVSGAIFLSAYDYSDKFKTAINIVEPLLEAIDRFGPYNVIQVITDNAPNCKVAGAIIEDKYPNIFWFGCLVHTLNLLMHGIVKNKNEHYKWIGDLYNKGKQMIKFITNHSNTHGLFRSHSRLELLKIAKTRFADRQGFELVEEATLDGMFWARARQVLDFTKPIYHMIRLADTDKPVICEVYEKMDTMLGQIKDIVHNNDPNLYKLIHDCVCVRWDKLNVPLHCLAYILMPKYYSTSWLGQPALGGGVRTKPHIDEKYLKDI